ncbi:Asp23/Gls24 family envelope stress response protein [Kribbella sp. NPDC056861]|uniref:Asp23/Gls24 family envelope stress response protein n=1 Tax=Kribbella sp. NPDC056861 TaxID=3154857 RepID=UPI0034480CAD
MADTASLAPPMPMATTDVGDAGSRGNLEISPRAIERIAEATAVQADGVLRQEATFGRGLPKAKVQLAGKRVRVDVELAVEWGFPLADLAAEVRGRLNRTIGTLTGLGVDSVSVDISAVELPDTHVQDSPRRVV